MEKLIIYLHPQHLNEKLSLSWVVVENESVIESRVEGDPANLSTEAVAREVIVIVPAFDVLLSTVNLPKMNRHRLLQAIPYALEEQLTEEVDALHFVAGEYQPDNHLSVVVISHTKMQEWLTLFKSWNVKVDRIIPASLALPFHEHTWHVLVQEVTIVRTGKYLGFACDKKNLNEFLNLALQQAANAPEVIHVHNYSGQAYSLDIKAKIIEQQKTSTQMMHDLAVNVGQAPTINLLQGTYAVKKSKFARKKIWNVIFSLAVTWITLLFCYPAVSYFILKERVSSIDKEITQIYKRNFPQSSSMVAPKLRMEEKLQKLTAAIGQNRLFLLMGYLGKGMKKATSVKLKRADFQNNLLTVELTAATSEEFSEFSDLLLQQGLNVKQQNANLAGAKVNATLQIE